MTNVRLCRYLYFVHQEIVFPADENPKTIENFLKKRFPIGYVRKLLRKNGVRVNGRKPKPDEVIAPGDHLAIYIPFQVAAKTSAASGHLPPEATIVYEDADMLVIDKPAGMAVHEAKGILKRDTLVGTLQARFRVHGIVPRLVHRLDKDTSGLLIVAKRQQAAEELTAAFANGRIDKEYLCLVAARVREKEGRIDTPLPGREGKAVHALTHYKVEKNFSDTTLLRVRIATGRMHQIRLHLVSRGYPVVLDERHGDFAFNKRFRKHYGLRRQFLHSARLTMERGGKKLTWTAPLPEDLRAALDALNKPTRTPRAT